MSHNKLLVALRHLNERELDILRSHFMKQEPLQELAARLGIAPSRVSQIKARALQKLKARLLAPSR